MSHDKKRLIIAIRGWTNTGDWLLFGRKGGEFPPETLEAIKREIPDSEIWAPRISLPFFCFKNPESIAQQLFAIINTYLSERPHIESVTLLGYSAGSLLARRVFCLAHGASTPGEGECHPVAWAKKIHRLVFIAGITRGWEISTASPAHVRFLLPVLIGLAFAVGLAKRIRQPSKPGVPFFWQLQRGSPFVVTTRIQYVRVIESLRAGFDQTAKHNRLTCSGIPTTVFLLGARDEFMSPADCTELGPRSEFAYIELPDANHVQALHISGDNRVNVIRRRRLIAALTESFQELNGKDWVVPPEDIDDYLDPMDLAREELTSNGDHKAVEHVVMVIHGIRDDGFWTKRVTREIKRLARDRNISIRAPTPSYGYFSMWDFVRPGGREQAARWFMERYADIRSHFPNAHISFVGHSNGTYIAGRALAVCPAIDLHRVVLAGSVLRCGYEWDKVGDQVNQVLNYVGSADNVVAFLPAVFEKLGLRFMDVGGAGAYGFDFAKEPLRSNLSFSFNEIEFVKGGHGAAIGEDSWPEIAKFIVTGHPPPSRTVEREGWLKYLYQLAPLFTLAGCTVVLTLLAAPLIATAWVAMSNGVPTSGIVLTIAAVLLGLFISWVAGRFLKSW